MARKILASQRPSHCDRLFHLLLRPALGFEEAAGGGTGCLLFAWRGFRRDGSDWLGLCGGFGRLGNDDGFLRLE